MKVNAHTQIWHLWLILGTVCDGMLVNLRGYRSLLVDLHNRYRATERAADMKEMVREFGFHVDFIQ